MEPTLNGTGAGQTDGEVLDIGCAFGVATIAALEAGGRVTASDLDPRHLEILTRNTPEALRSHLTCVTGQLPNIDLPDESYDAILCSRVLHFLDGSAIDASKLVPVYEARRKQGNRWPGLMIGLENYLPFAPKDRAMDGPPFMNLLDPELLSRTCAEAGFDVQRTSFIDRSDFRGLGRMDGRENAGAIAIKPNQTSN